MAAIAGPTDRNDGGCTGGKGYLIAIGDRLQVHTPALPQPERALITGPTDGAGLRSPTHL